MSAPQRLTNAQLDARLVPTFLRGLTTAQQCAILEGNIALAVAFRRQALELYVQSHRAYRAKQKGSCWNNYRVPWAMPEGALVVSWCSMASYYCHLLSTAGTGFHLLFEKIKIIEKNARKCCPRGSYGGVKW